MKISRAYLRSANGQVAVLAATFAGAALLAGVSVSLRSVFFERFVREKRAPLPERLVQVLAADPTGEKCLAASADDLAAIYGAWCDRDDPGGADALARTMLSLHGARTLELVRRTLAAGSARQRGRAIDLLAAAGRADLRPAAAELCRHALGRAARTGEEDLRRRAERALEELDAKG